MFSSELKAEATSLCSFFEAALQRERLSHAYLLCGGNNQLKDKLTEELTQLLNCSERAPDHKPCGKCLQCKWISEHSYPELPIVLEPDLEKSKKGVVLVKQVQELLSKLQNKTKLYRVIAIKRAEMEFLPAESANALLKTIEEPHQRSLFILYAQDREQVLPTIASRCQSLNLPNHPPEANVQIGTELLEKIERKRLNHFEVAKLSEEYLDDSKSMSVQDLLDQLIEVCLQRSSAGNPTYFLKMIALTEKAQHRLKSFCSPKATLEELFWRMSAA